MSFSASSRLCLTCIKSSGFVTVVRSDLHHFSDASESGYGEVTYNELHLDMYHYCSSACLQYNKQLSSVPTKYM